MNRFFIIGNPRSGTTLFRLMLNKHEKISVPPEASFLTWLYKNWKCFDFSPQNITQFIDELLSTKKIESWAFDRELLIDYVFDCKPSNYVELIDIIYKYYSEIKLDKKVIYYGDKNNCFLSEIDLINGLYPEAKFIHIIRDGRSVAASYQGVNKKMTVSPYAPQLPVDIKDIAKEWCSNIEKIENSFLNIKPDNRLVIRFEDLILTPRVELNKVCDFLGTNYNETMLEYYKTTQEQGLEPKEYEEWKAKNKKPLMKEEAMKYESLRKVDLIEFTNLADKLLKKYKYIGK